MFVVKMVSIRDQVKVGPRPDWTRLGFHSTLQRASPLFPLTTEFIPPHPPHPAR